MSQWTHVSGCIRVDAIPAMGLAPNLRSILNDNLPSGSEGGVQYEIINAGDGLVWKTVAIWGDLRDFGVDDIPQIDAWFERIVAASALDRVGTTRLMIRAATLLVEAEYGPRYLLMAGEPTSGSVHRVELPTASPANG